MIMKVYILIFAIYKIYLILHNNLKNDFMVL